MTLTCYTCPRWRTAGMPWTPPSAWAGAATTATDTGGRRGPTGSHITSCFPPYTGVRVETEMPGAGALVRPVQLHYVEGCKVCNGNTDTLARLERLRCSWIPYVNTCPPVLLQSRFPDQRVRLAALSDASGPARRRPAAEPGGHGLPQPLPGARPQRGHRHAAGMTRVAGQHMPVVGSDVRNCCPAGACTTPSGNNAIGYGPAQGRPSPLMSFAVAVALQRIVPLPRHAAPTPRVEAAAPRDPKPAPTRAG